MISGAATVQCAQCGNETPADDSNCHFCGAPILRQSVIEDTAETKSGARAAYRFAAGFWIVFSIYGFLRVASDPVGMATTMGQQNFAYQQPGLLLSTAGCMGVVQIWVAVAMLRHLSWARNTAIVLACIGIVVTLVGLPLDFHATNVLGGVGLAVLDDIAVLLMSGLTIWAALGTEQLRIGD